MSGGLNTHFLEIAFAWLFDADAGRATPAGEVEQRRNLVQAFWEHEAWCRTGSADEEDDDYKPMSPLGYKVAAELSRLTAEGPAATAAALWEPFFALGPLGHYSIGTFLSDWFSGISETTNATEFGQRWQPMIEQRLDQWSWLALRPAAAAAGTRLWRVPRAHAGSCCVDRIDARSLQNLGG